jgi:GNAT superfamily N-acetyltransferase
LAQESYWASGRSCEAVEKCLANSLCFSLTFGDALAGFARAITDRATFAYLADVFVLPEHRGQGLGKLLVDYILNYPELRELSWMLATADAQELYRKYGFVEIEGSQRYMRKPAPAQPWER